MTIRTADIERIVLTNACEDYAQLWQILAEIMQSRPTEQEDLVIKAARHVVRSFLNKGLLEGYRRESRTSAFVRLEPPELDAALDSDAYWRADPVDTVEISVAATKAGENAWRALGAA